MSAFRGALQTCHSGGVTTVFDPTADICSVRPLSRRKIEIYILYNWSPSIGGSVPSCAGRSEWRPQRYVALPFIAVNYGIAAGEFPLMQVNASLPNSSLISLSLGGYVYRRSLTIASYRRVCAPRYGYYGGPRWLASRLASLVIPRSLRSRARSLGIADQ
jgi:hypothetical protein